MDIQRRTLLQFGSVGAVSSLAGCSFMGSAEYVPVVVENSHNTKHAISIAVISPPEGSGGYTSYASEALQLDIDESETYDETLALADHPPNLLAMMMLDDETTGTAEFELRAELQTQIPNYRGWPNTNTSLV
jgi:hypothetical protein